MTSVVATPAASVQVPPHLPPRVQAEWIALVARHDPCERFRPYHLAGLPDAARRWLEHAIEHGALLRTCVELALHGQIRLGRWRDYTAAQALAPLEGYVWAETTRLAGGTVTGFDRLTQDEGEMRHVWRGRVPVMIASGPDLTRSAAGRLAAELPLVPAAALSPSLRWREVDGTEAVVVVPSAGRSHEVHLVVGPTGALREVRVQRWAKAGRSPYRERLFVARFDGEVAFDGFTVPRVTTAGYDEPGQLWPEGVFIRQVVDRAVYR